MSFTAVVLAAGKGTRMRSDTPKVLHDLCGMPMVAWPVQAAGAAGAQRVVVVVSPGTSLEGSVPEGTRTAVQEIADGTGGAVAAAQAELGDGPVVVLSGDVPLVTAAAIEGLVAAHRDAGAAATMATTVLADPTGYGRVVRAPDGSVERVVETKADGDASPAELEITEVNTGIYCFDSAALAEALPRVSTDNAQGERYLPEVLPRMREAGHTIAAHVVDDPALVLGVNDRADLARVAALARERIARTHLLNGVAITDPAQVSIDATVVIGQDTRIEPGCVLRGATTIGARASIGPHTTLVDTRVEDEAKVVHSYSVDAHVGPRVSVGPFAYLRPGTNLREGSKIGTFVEVKNSDVGAGSKVPHLSYLGDADVGERSNLGAGTITANYDGRAKHRTTIGADVRSSVDVSFVAPVTVGDRAVTGAGSVITEDVPPGALGIARARQANIDGYRDRENAEDAG